MKFLKKILLIALALLLALPVLLVPASADAEQTCPECGYAENKNDWKFCTMCGASLHVHTFAEEWSTDFLYHWHAATCEHTDLVADYEAHNIKRIKLGESPAEVLGSTCDVCGKYRDSYYAYSNQCSLNSGKAVLRYKWAPESYTENVYTNTAVNSHTCVFPLKEQPVTVTWYDAETDQVVQEKVTTMGTEAVFEAMSGSYYFTAASEGYVTYRSRIIRFLDDPERNKDSLRMESSLIPVDAFFSEEFKVKLVDQEGKAVSGENWLSCYATGPETASYLQAPFYTDAAGFVTYHDDYACPFQLLEGYEMHVIADGVDIPVIIENGVGICQIP